MSGVQARQAAKAAPRGQRSREAILNATIDVLREAGYHGLTIETVAARAAASKATVYRWWPSRTALVLDAIRHRINVPRIKATGDTRTDIRAVIQASHDVLVHSPLGSVLPALAVDILGDPDAAEQLAEYLRPRRESVAAIVDSAVASGHLPPDVDAPALLEVYAGTILYRTLITRRPTEPLVDQLTDLILQGRLPRRSHSSKQADEDARSIESQAADPEGDT